jgi:dimethylhistidine N-methyltransferase
MDLQGSSAAGALRQPRFVQLFQHDDARVRAELAAGLMAATPQVSPKFLYDPLGSRLFDAITELPEYYPTRTEAQVLQQHADAIASAIGPGGTLVDLGAGNCAKAGRLFGTLKPQRYVAVDISVDFLRQSLQCLQREHPQLDMLGVGCDFSSDLTLPPEAGDGPRTLFYPGSSIGNFNPEQALRFLRQAHAACQGGRLLIGVDLVKPVEVLVPAYDDALGVTAAFNRNLLQHVNARLGSDFQVADWAHVALFDVPASRIEMHLEARRAVVVRWPGGERAFSVGERLHTENSYKWSLGAFSALLRDAGFGRVREWTDPQRWFGVLVAEG